GLAVAGCGGGGRTGSDAGATDAGATDGTTEHGMVAADGSVAPTPSCMSAGGSTAVRAPTFVRNINVGETGWYSSPAVADLDGDGTKEIIAPFYSTFVYSAQGQSLGRGTSTMGRVYAPGVVADIDHDGTMDIVVGGDQGTVAAYTFRSG